MDGGVYDAFREIAQGEGRTVSELVREAIASLLRDRELVRKIREVTEENAALSGQRVALMRKHIMPGDLAYRQKGKEIKNEALVVSESGRDT